MTPDANDLCVFAVKRGDIEVGGSFSYQYYHWERTKIIESIKRNHAVTPYQLIEIVDFIREKEKAKSANCRYIGMASVESHTGCLSNVIETAEGDAFKFKKGDILYGKLRPYLNKVWLATFDGICSTEFHVLRIKVDNVQNELLHNILLSNVVLKQTIHMMTGNTHPRLSDEDVKKLLIPLPQNNSKHNLLCLAQNAYVDKIQYIANLGEDFKISISNLLGIAERKISKLCFAIHLRDLDGVIDAKRYSSMITHTSEFKISDVCDIVDEKVNVSRFDKKIIDWIRIDDLPNQPLDIEEVRTQPANEVEGTFFKVQEGDILVARLGPTILNQKIVMVRSIERTTIASAEFLVLRCKEGYSPEAVMAVLKTAYYRDLMYSHARGSTPSRYRLNREDMLKLPFPDIREHQDKIADDANNVREQVKAMRIQAEQEWQAAKEQFEKELLGE